MLQSKEVAELSIQTHLLNADLVAIPLYHIFSLFLWNSA